MHRAHGQNSGHAELLSDSGIHTGVWTTSVLFALEREHLRQDVPVHELVSERRAEGESITTWISLLPFISEYTCDKKRESDAHVLLMHKRDLNGQELVKMKRNSEQIWLLWHDESNENSPEIDQYKFNWTISYRISAEASLAAYGITIARQKSWLAQQLEHWIDEQFEQRANQAIW